ncbi:hypothetical protein C4D60_Mb08t06740 [Musa balbisiana]|uniref:RRM domain-containing protein n=1 Tax=Musa balbisiana TaxID=52838 RepID=A0A4S8K1U5_MUSBA|nr:hypothetical protein C4D60_Mb08t06740 [Musa balbisiana]
MEEPSDRDSDDRCICGRQQQRWRRLPSPGPEVTRGGLSKRTTSEGLREAFSKFGQIVYARVVTDRISGFSKGFGFVRYATLEEAAEGIKGMDGKFLDGWVIFAEYARPRLPLSGPTQPQTPPPQTSEPSSGF